MSIVLQKYELEKGIHPYSIKLTLVENPYAIGHFM